jgi:7,8-dihydropterin-6-yl-methyl-4-(beta-D-ribofuranosyl)aminobenzene 5'-phosphate synthase
MASISIDPGLAVVVENTSTGRTFWGQWGLSQALFPGNGSIWLFDAGSGGAVLPNLKALGIDPKTLEGIILSHGHWDHADGLADLFRAGYTGKILAHPGFNVPRYRKFGNEPATYIGVDLELIPVIQERLEPVEDSAEPTPGLQVFYNVKRLPSNDQPGIAKGKCTQYLDKEGTRPDPILDDGFVIMHTPRGPVAALGCCHSGLANSLAHLRENTGIDRLYAVVGGTHLVASDEAGMEQAAAALKEFQVERVVPCHCTGMVAWAGLRNKLGQKIEATGAGTVLTFV